jgi:hypothetical protein
LAVVGIAVACALAGVSCSQEHTCPLIFCSSGIEFVAWLPQSRDVLGASAVTLCRNDLCATAGPSSAGATTTSGTDDAPLAFTGPVAATGSLTTTPDGRSAFRMSVNLDAGPEAADGDRYSIKVVGPDGTVLLDLTRGVDYQTYNVACGAPCRSALVQVWPTSQSGLTCGGKTCESGATLVFHLNTPPASPPSLLVCRNDVCSSQVRMGIAGCKGNEMGDVSLSGSLTADVTYACHGSGTLDVTFHVPEDPMLLADGDHYAASIIDASGPVLGAIDKTATYQETFPNGVACDTYPCRSVTLAP